MTSHRPRGAPAPLGRVAAVVAAALVAAATAVFATTAAAGPTPAAANALRSPPTPTPTPAPVVPGSYVALGDSFTSGPAIATQLGPSTTPPAPGACLRSSQNYPSLTARALGLQLEDVSCSGATTDDVVRSQAPGIPAQLSALEQSTDLVTVGIGGNDLGFSTIAANCASYTPWGPTRVGWSCRAHYTEGGADQLAATVEAVGASVAGVLREVRKRAPYAKVFVIGYPHLVPPTGSGCWPALPFRATDLDFLRGVEAELDTTLASAAAGAGDHYVDLAAPSEGHSACASRDVRWVEPVLPSPGSYPLHPDATGMAGMAGVLEATMESTGAV